VLPGLYIRIYLYRMTGKHCVTSAHSELPIFCVEGKTNRVDNRVITAALRHRISSDDVIGNSVYDWL